MWVFVLMEENKDSTSNNDQDDIGADDTNNDSDSIGDNSSEVLPSSDSDLSGSDK